MTPRVGDIIAIHDLGSSVHNTAAWHRAEVVEVRSAADDEEGHARLCAKVTGYGDQFWRRLDGPDLRWRPINRCASPSCPGLTWSASDYPHPYPCTVTP